MEPDLKLILDGDIEGTTSEICVGQQIMANASPFFRAMLSPDRFSEGTPSETQRMVEVKLAETNSSSMQVLCDIFHLRSKSIPIDGLSSEELVDIAILVDKFDCRDAVLPWSQKWMEQTHAKREMDAVDHMSLNDLKKWACICHVFGDTDRVQRYLHKLTLYMTSTDLSQDESTYLDYLPQPIVDEIKLKRSETANEFQLITVNLIHRLENGQTCHYLRNRSEDEGFATDTTSDEEAFHCSSVLLGNALLAVRRVIGHTWDIEAWNGSIAEMHQQMLQVARKLNGPSFVSHRSSKKRSKRHEACSGTAALNVQIETIIARVDPRSDGRSGLLPRMMDDCHQD